MVLVGLMGSGKSTVGRLLADLWQVPFLDLDEAIEEKSGMSIDELFDQEGEAGFREREAEATRALSPEEPVVVAVGGGWMARPELRDSWTGVIRVWLRVSPREAANRLAASETPRPLLTNHSSEEVLKDLLAQRLPSYHLSEYTVDTSGRTAAEVAKRIAVLFEQMEVRASEGTNDPEFSMES